MVFCQLFGANINRYLHARIVFMNSHQIISLVNKNIAVSFLFATFLLHVFYQSASMYWINGTEKVNIWKKFTSMAFFFIHLELNYAVVVVGIVYDTSSQ